MNSSFSKKRHISEANSVLESRFIKNRIIESKDAVLNEQAAPPKIYTAAEMAKDPDWGLNFPCIKDKIGAKIYKRQGTTPTIYIWAEDKSMIYSNGRITDLAEYAARSAKRYWFCDPENPSDILTNTENNDTMKKAVQMGLAITQQAPTNSSLPGASSSAASSDVKKTLNQTLQWKDCSKKGVYQLGCMDPRPQDQNDIKKIQGCIGVKQDGYFGERTMKTLNKKFPNLGGVARVSDINTICQSQITPVGQSGDNTMELDPKYKVDNPVKAPVVNPNTETQPPEDWVETPQSSPAQSQTPETPAPQLDPKQKKKLTDQYRKLSEKYSSERAKILKKTPTATDDQIKQQLKPLLDELNRIYQQIK